MSKKKKKIEKDASKTELNQNSDNVVVQPESPRNAQNSSCYGDDVPLSSNIEITEADVKIEATETSGVAIVEMPNEESEDEEKHESTQFPGPSNTTFQNSNLHQNPHSGYQFPNPMMNSSLPDQMSRNAFPTTSENDGNPWALMQMSGLSLQNELQQYANRTPPKKLCPKSYTTKSGKTRNIDPDAIYEPLVVEKVNRKVREWSNKGYTIEGFEGEFKNGEATGYARCVGECNQPDLLVKVTGSGTALNIWRLVQHIKRRHAPPQHASAMLDELEE